MPNVHLQRGATLVAYSGGKCLRGPQTAGLLLGDKRLVRAAWVHSAPHHGYARGMKVGKEEAVAMLMAVEMWTRRNHDAEWTQWTSWLDHIAGRLGAIDGVTTTVVQPEGLSNRTPSLKVLWSRDRVGVSGERVARILFDTDPRVALFAAPGDEPGRTGVSITPYMLNAGEERVVADRLYALLSSPPAREPAPAVSAPAADLTGQWDVHIEYAAGSSVHALHLRQRGKDIDGAHQGEFVTRALTGTIDGDTVHLSSTYDESHGDALTFTFAGTYTNDQMSGTLDMGEYLSAAWTARRAGAGELSDAGRGSSPVQVRQALVARRWRPGRHLRPVRSRRHHARVGAVRCRPLVTARRTPQVRPRAARRPRHRPPQRHRRRAGRRGG